MAGEGQDVSPNTRRKSAGHHVRRLKSERSKSQRAGSSIDSTAGKPDPVSAQPDVESLRQIRVEHYNAPPGERRTSNRANMTYVSESVTRVPILKSEVRHVSKRSTSKSRRRHEDSEHTNQRRKIRVVDKSHDESGYVYRAERPRAVEECRTNVSSAVRTNTQHRSDPDLLRSNTKRTKSSRRDEGGRRVEVVSRREAPVRRQSEPIQPLNTQRHHSASERSEDSQEEDEIHRSVSIREQAPLSKPRPPLLRSKTTTTRSVSVSDANMMSRRSSRPARENEYERISSKDTRKGSSFFSLLRAPSTVTPSKKVTCLTCMADDVSIHKSAKLSCGHRMCHDCLKRIFTMSVTDPQHMPPRCCTNEHIPLKHVDALFDHKFKVNWNNKFQEYTTRNRIYCPSRGCGEWIKPKDIYTDGGRKYGKCKRCHTKVCCICNGKWHTSRDCPKDEETKKFVEVAKKEGWQRCFNCSAMVELKEGCNHMTCRCTAEFCMICGHKWKTCDCPWFNYQAVEADRLNHMNIPQARRVYENGGGRNPVRYQEEMDRRREQERRDEVIARRLQVLGLDEGDPRDDNVFGIGNAAGHFMNQDFVRQATNILTGNYRQAQRAANELLNGNITGRENPLPPPPFLDPLPEEDVRAPPASRPSDRPLLRNHSLASRAYNNAPTTRPSERVIPRRNTTDYATEAARHAPVGTNPAAALARRGTVRSSAPPRRQSGIADITRVGGNDPPPDAVDRRIERWRDEVPMGEAGPGAEDAAI